MLKFKKERLFSKGEFDYNGGIYNPSCLQLSKDIKLISLRCEYDYCTLDSNDWFRTIPDLKIIGYYQNEIFNDKKLKLIDFPEISRIEDCRLFNFNEYIFASGVILTPDNLTPRIFIALIELSAEIQQINLIKIFGSPNDRCEKNWGFFVKEEELYFIYSISPWCIFKVNTDWSIEMVENENFDGKWFTNNFLAVSTLPIEYEGNYLMFFHTKDFGFYHQGALIFSKDFIPLYFTTEPLFNYRDLAIKGRNKRVCYISGVNVLSDEIELYFGEGDTNSSVLKFNKEEFNKIIYNEKINSLC